MSSWVKCGTWIGMTVLVASCGKGPSTEAAPEPVSASGGERTEQQGDTLSVTGLRGTLSQHEIQNALEPRMPKFSRCLQKRMGDLEWLSGKVEFQFRVAIDGSVAVVYPSQSSMGDRVTERCMLEVAKGTHFPAPHGGEAEFSWPLDVPSDPNVRPPVEWSTSAAGTVITDRTAELKAQCPGGPYGVTVYVDIEGKVVAAGASTSDEASAAQLDCVAQSVSTWTFPSPGSYAAKLSFTVD